MLNTLKETLKEMPYSHYLSKCYFLVFLFSLYSKILSLTGNVEDTKVLKGNELKIVKG